MFGGIKDLMFSNSYYISDSNIKLFTLKIDVKLFIILEIQFNEIK
jgi:hypothetical protein